MKARIVILVGLVALLAPSGARAATATLNPVADAYVSSQKPSANYGTSLKLVTDGQPRVYSYLKFQLTGLPADATITGLKLRVYATKNGAAGYQVHRGDSGWQETGITYATAPGFDSFASGSSGPISGAPRWTEVSLSLNPAPALGGPLTLVMTTTGRGALSFMSKEDLNDPQLVVDYSSGEPPPSTSDPILVGAGDIASAPSGASGDDEATAKLLDSIVSANPGKVTVFTAGDNAYDSGTATEFASYYDPTWGRHKSITRPSLGNHEYLTPGASGYFGYFGAAAGDPATGYYAYNVGAWRVYSLNSEIARGTGSTQEQWLRSDLSANAGVKCVLAYWHRPRFSSGTHGSDSSMQPLWQALYDHGADVIVAGHDHNYQRFAPQTATGAADPATGIREFVVGTGGRSHYSFTTPIANTEAYNTDTYGVLKLTLHATSYDFEFVPQAGRSYSDKGTGAPCH